MVSLRSMSCLTRPYFHCANNSIIYGSSQGKGKDYALLDYLTEYQHGTTAYKTVQFVAKNYNRATAVNADSLTVDGCRYFTPNHFKCQNKRTENMLADIHALAVDIDYKKSDGINTSLKPLEVFTGLVEPLIGKIAPPSYIEYGNQLRLIYILAEPVRLYKGKRARWITTCKSITRYFAKVLNEEADLCAEPQQLCSFFRVPLSVNEKTGDIIQVVPYSDERYTAQELLDGYIPVAPKRDIVVHRKGKVLKVHTPNTLWIERKGAFERARTLEGVHRQNLCHLYATALLWLDSPDVLASVLEFNKGFPKPYSEKYLRSKLSAQIRSRKKYRYTNSKINEMVGKEIIKMTKREKAKLEKIKNGTTRKQIAESNYQKVCALYDGGMGFREIADTLSLSEKRVQQLITKHRKELKAL